MTVVVVGSLNRDLVAQVQKLPRAGATVIGTSLETHAGGKGGNQAVACARLGAPVRMVARVGRDAFGDALRNSLTREGVDVSAVRDAQEASGVALVTVDDHGENSIVVIPGANASLSADDLNFELFVGARVVVLQLEVALPTVRRAAQLGRAAGACVVLNAAPAQALSSEDLADVDVLVVNEDEAEILSGCTVQDAGAFEVAAKLSERGVAVVMTLGPRGAVWAERGLSNLRSRTAFAVNAVDTTAAGDAFVGALAVSLSEGGSLSEAVRWGCAAGALTATKRGAQISLPRRPDIEQLMTLSSELSDTFE